jgi:hypothetical protein
LRRARAAAWLRFRDLTPSERRALNEIPRAVALPHPAAGYPTFSARLGSYLVTVPEPEETKEHTQWLVLAYPRFEVKIVTPFHKPMDTRARELHFKDSFDALSAVYRARLDDIDVQPDLASLKKHLELLTLKISAVPGPSSVYFAEFDRRGPAEKERLQGIIAGDFTREDRTIVEAFIPATGDSCGMIFTNSGTASMGDILNFLGAIQFDLVGPATTTTEAPSTSAPAPATRQDAAPVPGDQL